MSPYRILSLDGGGSSSLISILWLYRLQERLTHPLHTYFDLIAGISSGSIIACQLSAGVEIHTILQQWLQEGTQIFVPQSVTGLSLFNRSNPSLYRDRPFNTILQKKFGDRSFGNLIKTPTIVVSYDKTHRQVVVFNNSNPVHADLPIWQICRASAALPFVFPAYPLSVAGEERLFIDGAVVGKNPSIPAIAAAFAHHRHRSKDLQPHQILLTSVGVARLPELSMPSLLKLTRLSRQLSSQLIHAVLEGTSELNHVAVQDILPPDNYYRFQLECSPENHAIISKLDTITFQHCKDLATLLDQYLQQPEANDQLNQIAKRLERSHSVNIEHPNLQNNRTEILSSNFPKDSLTSLIFAWHPTAQSTPKPERSPSQSVSTSKTPVQWDNLIQSRFLRFGYLGISAFIVLTLFTQFQRDRGLGYATASDAVVETSQPSLSNLPAVNTTIIQLEPGYTLQRQYTGQLQSQRTSELGFERSGQVVQILVEPGDRVMAGEPLAYLNDAELVAQEKDINAQRNQAIARLNELNAGATQQSIEAATARLEGIQAQAIAAQARHQRRQSLYDQGAISAEQLSEAETELSALLSQQQEALSQLENLQAGSRPEQIQAQQARIEQIDAAATQLEVEQRSHVLTAPFSGTIADRLVDEGTVVSAGQPLVRLVESEALEAQVNVPVSSAYHLTAGSQQTVEIQGHRHNATITAILPEADTNTGQATVLLSIHAAQALPGQLVSLHLTQQTDIPGFWLPSTALVTSVDGLWTCYVLKPLENQFQTVYQLQPETVEILYTEGDRVFVRGTLQTGDRIVATGTHRLVPQQQVVIAENF